MRHLAWLPSDSGWYTLWGTWLGQCECCWFYLMEAVSNQLQNRCSYLKKNVAVEGRSPYTVLVPSIVCVLFTVCYEHLQTLEVTTIFSAHSTICHHLYPNLPEWQSLRLYLSMNCTLSWTVDIQSWYCFLNLHFDVAWPWSIPLSFICKLTEDYFKSQQRSSAVFRHFFPMGPRLRFPEILGGGGRPSWMWMK